MQDDYWKDVVVLKKGMKVKDLPQDWRCALAPPSYGSQPELSFRNGSFHVLTYIEWDVFESPIPWGSTIKLDRHNWSFSYDKPPLSPNSQVRLAEIAMRPEGYGFTGRLAQKLCRNIIWC